MQEKETSPVLGPNLHGKRKNEVKLTEEAYAYTFAAGSHGKAKR